MRIPAFAVAGMVAAGCGGPAPELPAAGPGAPTRPAAPASTAPSSLPALPPDAVPVAPAVTPPPPRDPPAPIAAPVPPGTPDRRDAPGGDMAAMMRDSWKASRTISIHRDLAVGQWATWEASGTEMWWGVTGRRGDGWIVEHRMKLGGPWLVYGYVVDADGNVREAYLANHYPDGVPDVAFRAEIVEPTDCPAGETPEVSEGEEIVNAAARDWHCKWTSIHVGGKEARTWMADDAWFVQLIKAQYDGQVTMLLKAVGTDATPGFRFPE